MNQRGNKLKDKWREEMKFDCFIYKLNCIKLSLEYNFVWNTSENDGRQQDKVRFLGED